MPVDHAEPFAAKDDLGHRTELVSHEERLEVVDLELDGRCVVLGIQRRKKAEKT
jgi:hypothetical protein